MLDPESLAAIQEVKKRGGTQIACMIRHGRVKLCASNEEEARRRMARLLVAEDDHLMRWSLENLLSRGGYAVDSVDSGEAAIDAAKGGNYQVVITDYTLPGSDGLDVLWWVKAQSPETHVIIITGHPMAKLERLARNVGAFDVLEKPFQFQSLKQSVERALATPESRRGPRTCCGHCTWQVPCDFWIEKSSWKPN